MSGEPDDEIIATLIAQANDHANAWADAMRLGDFAGAAQLAIVAIQDLCAVNLLANSIEFREHHFSIRVLLNGLRDVANVRLVVGRAEWIEFPKAIETVWHLAHDARERLEDHRGLSTDFAAYCMSHIEPIFTAIKDRFGHGWYSSWEMECDTVTCSICNSDIRGCDHVSGRWYGDQHCEYRPQGGMITAVALTQSPKDPRCRLWPWKMKKDPTGEMHKFAKVPIYIIFNVEGDVDGGSIVGPDELFQPADES